jgi:hypothetical protein
VIAVKGEEHVQIYRKELLPSMQQTALFNKIRPTYIRTGTLLSSALSAMLPYVADAAKTASL